MTQLENPWIELWSCTWLHEAHFLKSVLESAGIEVLLPDQHTLGVDPFLGVATGGVRLLVRSDDVQRAREIIGSASRPPSPPDHGRGDAA